ncbi:MAG TPA: urea ABC transporter substrate-binding protein [Devosia sp.]|nr:urea ABC transporter substrate-binding protein [Devosia sp.]HEV2518617.1 urea ABC transporter substrate-binding protein [Devosia sp.]
MTAGALAPLTAYAQDTIKVGVLHSLSGTMAISETTLKDTMLFLIDEQNKKGGVLGKKLEAVVVDPASDWPLFAEKARELIAVNGVAAVFGCWTSSSRKSVLPVFKELNSILFYPVQYEGEESEKNVIYTGAAPNQQAIPAVDYLMSEEGGSVKRWVLEATDYVYPRTTNKILEQYLKDKGVAPEDIKINYTPFGFADWQTEVAAIKEFGSAGKKTAVVSTINGDANVPFYKELANQGVSAEDIPVVAFSVGEEELAGFDTSNLVGHLAAWNYFQSVDNPANAEFIKNWHAFIGDDKRTTNDPMEAAYLGFQLWVQAVEKAGTTDTDAVLKAIVGLEVPNLTGGTAKVLPNHHLTKPVLIGEIQADGQFETVWQTEGDVPGAAWSEVLPENKDISADWTDPLTGCGRLNTATNTCEVAPAAM